MHVVELPPERSYGRHNPHHNALLHRGSQRRHQLPRTLSKPLQQHRLRRSIHDAYRHTFFAHIFWQCHCTSNYI